jgi:hypothetical protein
MKTQDAKRKEQERHISAQPAQTDSDAGHTLLHLPFSLSCADDHDYPNRLPGYAWSKHWWNGQTAARHGLACKI